MNTKKALFCILSFCSVMLLAAETETTTEVSQPKEKAHVVNAGLDIQYTPVHFRNYRWYGNESTNRAGTGMRLAGEWLPFAEHGKFGVGASIGYYAVRNASFSGGRFASMNVIPVELYLSFRFDFIPDQVFVPFVKTGLEKSWVAQTGYQFTGMRVYNGLNLTGGFELCLNRVDPDASFSLARNVGIHNTYLIAEYMASYKLGDRPEPDLSRSEYRVGLRFEM